MRLSRIFLNYLELVLLWPYLFRFFNLLDLLLPERRFITKYHAKKGALLLRYLADGSTAISETELPLNNVLCGVDFMEPIETDFELTDQEKTECWNLLQTVIGHWKTSGIKTPNGLRSSFLCRESVLKIQGGSWLLQLEKKTYDILLDRLPWSICAVKLPWMEKLLIVEW